MALLKDMLENKPENRPSAKECLNQEFFSQDEDQAIMVGQEENLGEQMKNFSEKYPIYTLTI